MRGVCHSKGCVAGDQEIRSLKNLKIVYRYCEHFGTPGVEFALTADSADGRNDASRALGAIS